MSKSLGLATGSIIALACAFGCIEVRDMVEAATATPPPVELSEQPPDNTLDRPTQSPTDGDTDESSANDEGNGSDADEESGDDASADDPANSDSMPVDEMPSSPPPMNAGDDSTDDSDATDDMQAEGIPPLPGDAVVNQSETGLEFVDFEAGSGPMPDADARVRVAYTGYLPDGTIFDSSDSATFGLANLIAGFAEGVQGMSVGGRRRVIIPPELGYGESGNPGAGIGGDDTITFDVELLEILGN